MSPTAPLLLIVLSLTLAGSTSRPSVPVIPADGRLTTVPNVEPDLGRWTPTPNPSPSAVVTPRPSPDHSAGASVTGIASWFVGAGVAVRRPRGTALCVRGPLGSWCGRSADYGPAKWTGRIVDLSPAAFLRVCGPLSLGLCRVTLTIG